MTVQALAPDTYRPHDREVRPLTVLPHQTGPAARQVGVRVLGSDPLSREGVIRFLQECADVLVLADQDTGPAQVVVVVVDRLGDETLPMLRCIRKDVGPRIVLLVGDLDIGRTADVMNAGAMGIMRRGEVTRSALRRLIRSVYAGEAVVPPDVLNALLGRQPQSGPGGYRPAHLGITDREEKVLRLLADGADTREIAHRLCYSERTVKTVIQDIANRFGLRNRSHAVAYAIRQGLI